MKKIALSVVIPVYNGETFLRDCLNSVLAEARDLSSEISLSETVDFEIICIDDASRDRSVSIISADFASVTLLCNNRNRGFAYTCNLGMSESRGEYIFLLNQDTRLRKGTVKSLVERLQRDEKIAFIGPRFVGFDGELQRKCASFPTFANVFWKMVGMSRIFPESQRFANLQMGWFDHLSESKVEQPMGAALMFRRDILQEVGYLDESFPIYFNDVDWMKRAIVAGYYNLYFPEAVVEHFVGGSTLPQKARMIRESHRSLYSYLKKWNPRALSFPTLFFWKVFLGLSGIMRSWRWSVFSSRNK